MLQTDLFADDEVESVICQLVSAAVGQDQKKKQGKICFKMVESTLKKVLKNPISLLIFAHYFFGSMGKVTN